jgi:hypothetical protein
VVGDERFVGFEFEPRQPASSRTTAAAAGLDRNDVRF